MNRPSTFDNPQLWITYAWEDDTQGDLRYLVQELANVGVTAVYDKVALVPGQRLWDQIGEKISSGPFHGWAYLVTPKSLASQACKEELAYALDRAHRRATGLADTAMLSSRRYRQTDVASLPFRGPVDIMVHLGSKIGWQAIQFFIWNAATGFEKSFPEGLMGFACTCGGWGLLTSMSLAMRLV